MSWRIKFSNFFKNGDAVLILQGRVGQEPFIMKREDSLDFVLEFLKTYGVDNRVIREVEKTARKKWKKFDMQKTKCWEDVKSFSEF